MKPAQVPLRILYIFAGEHRQADIGDYFRKWVAKYNRHGGLQLSLELTELDAKRGGSDHDLLDATRQQHLIKCIEDGYYDLVLAAPPCNSFSRATFSSKPGPPPVRDLQWPNGFPWLSGAALARATEGNVLAEFALDCLRAVIIARARHPDRHVHGWLECPEDLGSTKKGYPASLRQMNKAQDLEGELFHRGAVYQCEWAQLDYSKHTGIITSIPQLWSSTAFHQGWPKFRHGALPDGTKVPRLYDGPLPRLCIHHGHKGLIGTNQDGDFHTSPTGAYPAELCQIWAQLMWQNLRLRIEAASQSTRQGHRLRSFPIQGDHAKAFKDAAGIPWSDSLRKHVSGKSVTLGLVWSQQGSAHLHMPPSPMTLFAARANTMLWESLRYHGLHLCWSSIQVNWNTESDWHTNRQHIGASAILGLGNFSGGEFHLQGFDPISIAGQLALFDGGTAHRSLSFTGDRLSLVFFRHYALFQADGAVISRLKAMGFILDDPFGWVPPLRASLSDPVNFDDPRLLYIGRGCSRPPLAKSKWHNPFRISKTLSRDQALKLFERRVRNSPELVRSVRDLDARVLLCHCTSEQACHADVLTRIFLEQKKAQCHVLDKAPPTDHQALAEAERRRALIGSNFNAKIKPTMPSVEQGWGSPLQVRHGQGFRILFDGGGLCSPGLWAPEFRKPVPPGSRLRAAIWKELQAWDQEEPGVLTRTVACLSTGNASACPFPQARTQKLKATLQGICSREIHAWGPPPSPLDHAMDLPLLWAFLKACGDPDYEVLKSYIEGVPIGIGVDLPRTPLVFPEKHKWSIPEQPLWGGVQGFPSDFQGRWMENYSSAKELSEAVKRSLQDMAKKGQVIQMTEKAARAKYGDKLSIGALGAIKKGTGKDGQLDVRIIHDGTNGVDINKYICVRDAVPLPLAADVKRVMREQAASQLPFAGITIDIEAAHRTVKVRPQDWGYLACRAEPQGDVFINTCGTYGFASAAYWWGRLAAMIHRACHYVSNGGPPTWMLLFADDWDVSAGGSDLLAALLTTLWVMVVFEVPVNWRKCHGGQTYVWIGYETCMKSWRLGISASRAQWLEKWFGTVLHEGKVNMRDLRGALGRMVFVYGAIPYDKPFLAPLFTLASLHPLEATVDLPLFAKMVIQWLRDRIRDRRSFPCLSTPSLGPAVMRVDAKAEGAAVAIGGWRPVFDGDGLIQKDISPWFSIKLSEADAPWAFSKGLPYKTISALELLATTVGLMLLAPFGTRRDPGRGVVMLSGLTDSQVSANVVAKGISTSFPLCCVAMELAAQLEAHNVELAAQWVPRNVNAEADALADGTATGFTKEFDVSAKFADIKFLVLPRLMSEATSFYKAAKAARGSAPPQSGGQSTRKRKKGASLREREPW